jgi:hypothetical protein
MILCGFGILPVKIPTIEIAQPDLGERTYLRQVREEADTVIDLQMGPLTNLGCESRSWFAGEIHTPNLPTKTSHVCVPEAS